MAKIAYILLCHKDPDAIILQAQQLTAAGDFMAIHFDARASVEDFATISAGLADNPNVALTRKRVKCGWGEWSLVQATLNTLTTAMQAFPRATHFYMLSGDCMAIKTAQHAHDFLNRNDTDFIESFDFFASDWIKTGMKEDRLIYRHFFNERTHKSLFYASCDLQKKLGLSRKIPEDLQIQIGSQWWCLRRRTVEGIMEFLRQRRDVIRFFKTTWIPDETFFQTLVRHLVPSPEIDPRTLTFLMFTDYGMPVNFYNDHYDLLLAQDFLFARKISPGAVDLKLRLGKLYASENVPFKISDEGRSLHEFLTTRGRTGRRFAPRFWETESTLGRERQLLIITCKKWHVAKRVLARLRDKSGLPGVEFLFNEESTQLPDLGGFETSLHKRTRHRRALTRMLFEYFDSNTLIVCIDPGSLELIQDFYSDRSQTRLLQINCTVNDDFLTGHAHRTGLAGAQTTQTTLERLLPTIRNDIQDEADRIRDAEFDHHYILDEAAPDAVKIQQLQAFLPLSPAQAKALATAEDLFVD